MRIDLNKIKSNRIFVAVFVLLTILVVTGIFIFKNILPAKEKKIPFETGKVHSSCLTNDEAADYPINEKSGPALKYPKELPLIISVRDKNTLEEKFKFDIPDIFIWHYHPLELHRCGVYAIKEFNYNPKLGRQLPGYKVEIWKYQYNGEGSKLITLGEINESGEFLSDYAYDFRVDLAEIYIVLEKSYLGQPDYALVIKNLETLEDIFILPLQDIANKNPSLLGSLGMREWTKDGKYFWGDIFVGANVLAFFRIERDTWKYEIFEAPKGTMGGDAFNFERGYITYDTGAPWSSVVEIDEQVKKEWQSQGKITSFYLYNLFTEEQILLATSTDPTLSFQARWLSETALEYYTQVGEKKIYQISD